MKKIALAAFYSVLFAACTGDAQPQSQNTIAADQKAAISGSVNASQKPKLDASKFVNFSVEQSVLKAGSASAAEIKLKIQEPFHINSNPPSEKSFIPLEIILENANGISTGKPVYPKGELRKFAFSEDKFISVYTGEIGVKVPLTIDKSAAGQRMLGGKLKFQPCDEEVCYRPQTIDINLPVTIN